MIESDRGRAASAERHRETAPIVPDLKKGKARSPRGLGERNSERLFQKPVRLTAGTGGNSAALALADRRFMWSTGDGGTEQSRTRCAPHCTKARMWGGMRLSSVSASTLCRRVARLTVSGGTRCITSINRVSFEYIFKELSDAHLPLRLTS